jgi:hypothetical protein
MNRTLIKNLYVQCVVEKGKEKSFQVRDLDTAELFAERIVRECVDICDAYGMPDGTSPTAMILSYSIKKHFGVEP